MKAEIEKYRNKLHTKEEGDKIEDQQDLEVDEANRVIKAMALQK